MLRRLLPVSLDSCVGRQSSSMMQSVPACGPAATSGSSSATATQVQRRIRRRLHRRTLRSQHPPRASRPHPDHQPEPCRSRAARVRAPRQASSNHYRTAHHRRAAMSNDATSSVGCCTSISRWRDLCRVSGTPWAEVVAAARAGRTLAADARTTGDGFASRAIAVRVSGP
jgi:hypothetical protein